ncbi:hypothetical protein K2P56_00990 [Patescibacteria group bacterium]|nr:hypothetical protein [Patescibacteria group bacterium]
MLAQIKSFLGAHKDRLYVIAVLILVALISFGLGRLSVFYGERGEFKVVYPEAGAGEQGTMP